LECGTLGAAHRYTFTAMRVSIRGSSDSRPSTPSERAKTSCAVPSPAAPAARPATPDAVNTSSRCWPVHRSINDAAAHPTPAPPAADRCCRGCSGADPACTPVAIGAARLTQRLAGSRRYPFGSGHPPGIRPVIRHGRRRGRPHMSLFPAAFRPPAFASRVILRPPGNWAFLMVG